MIKDQLPFDKILSPNTNVTEQLYEQFIILKDYLDTSKNKKQHHKNQQQDQSQQNHNKFEEQQNTNQKQKYLKQHKNQHNMIINKPKPSRKWLKFINKNESNNSQDQSQQQIYTNSPQLNSEYKNQQVSNHLTPYQQLHRKNNQNKPFNLNLNITYNQQTKRSKLIDEYTQLYEYSIKKVIENNNRRIKKKRKRNQDSQQKQNTIKHIASNLQYQFNKQDENNILSIEDKNRLKISENTVKPRDNSQIARKLIFNHQDPHQKDNQHQQNTTQQTNIFVQHLLVPFQTSMSKMINSHSQRLKQIDQNLSKIKLFMHGNNQKQTKSKDITQYQPQQKQQKVSKSNENYMQSQIHQNQINKLKQNVQALQFNEFDEEYVPDDTSSLYSQTIQGRDLQFDQQT